MIGAIINYGKINFELKTRPRSAAAEARASQGQSEQAKEQPATKNTCTTVQRSEHREYYGKQTHAAKLQRNREEPFWPASRVPVQPYI